MPQIRRRMSTVGHKHALRRGFQFSAKQMAATPVGTLSSPKSLEPICNWAKSYSGLRMLVFGTTISSGMVGGLAAAICVPVIFALLRKTQSYKYVGEAQVANDELTGRYRKWDLVARLLLIPLAGMSAYVFWLLLCTIESKRAALLGSADFVLTPIPIFFAIPALFAGILFAAMPLKVVLSRILGSEGYEQLLKYSDRRLGINSHRVTQHLVYVAVPLIVGSVMLAFQTYATAGTQGLTIHPYFAIHERYYGWADVNRVTLVRSFSAPNGSIRRDRPYYIVEMADGFQLNFHRTLLEIPIPDQRRLAAFVAEHAHRNVDVDDPHP
jgi:hypothetical protein